MRKINEIKESMVEAKNSPMRLRSLAQSFVETSPNGLPKFYQAAFRENGANRFVMDYMGTLPKKYHPFFIYNLVKLDWDAPAALRETLKKWEDGCIISSYLKFSDKHGDCINCRFIWADFDTNRSVKEFSDYNTIEELADHISVHHETYVVRSAFFELSKRQVFHPNVIDLMGYEIRHSSPVEDEDYDHDWNSDYQSISESAINYCLQFGRYSEVADYLQGRTQKERNLTSLSDVVSSLKDAKRFYEELEKRGLENYEQKGLELMKAMLQ